MIQYNKETRSFGFMGMGQKTQLALGTAATVVGLATSVAQARRTLGDKDKYSVVFKGRNGRPIHKSVRATSMTEAIQKVRSTTGGYGYRAFRIPEQDMEAQHYYNSLMNS